MQISSCLIDTNVLLRISKRSDPFHPLAFDAVNAMNLAGVPLFYTHQNIAELWNVMTRPMDKNGFGLSVEQAETEVQDIESGMNLLAEDEAVYRHWRALLTRYRIVGVQVHDARLVASMQVHGIEHLLTFNTADFSRFSEVEIIHPERLAEQK
jgi:predicted nucleic acid-binding protein